MKFLQNGDYIELISAVNPGVVVQGFFYRNEGDWIIIGSTKNKKARICTENLSFLESWKRKRLIENGFIYVSFINAETYTKMPIEEQLKHFKKLPTPAFFYLPEILITIKNELL
jgi:hypothetical protein